MVVSKCDTAGLPKLFKAARFARCGRDHSSHGADGLEYIDGVQLAFRYCC